MLQFGGRPVRGFALGSSGDDVRDMQKAVGAAQQRAGVAVNGCQGKLDPKSLADWSALSQRAGMFVAADVPMFVGVDAMYAQGNGIRGELDAWANKLKSGCAAVSAATPVAPVQRVPSVSPKATAPSATPAAVPDAPSGTSLSTAGWIAAGVVVAGVVAGGVALAARARRAA